MRTRAEEHGLKNQLIYEIKAGGPHRHVVLGRDGPQVSEAAADTGALERSSRPRGFEESAEGPALAGGGFSRRPRLKAAAAAVTARSTSRAGKEKEHATGKEKRVGHACLRRTDPQTHGEERAVHAAVRADGA